MTQNMIDTIDSFLSPQRDKVVEVDIVEQNGVSVVRIAINKNTILLPLRGVTEKSVKMPIPLTPHEILESIIN